jgi:outer membrane protein assembly factor BamB
MGVNAKWVAGLIAGWALAAGGCERSLSTPLGAGGGAGTGSVVGPSSACASASRPSTYHLVRRRNLASPAPDPTGLAFDGQALWILSGGYSPPDTVSTLVRFDPDQLTVDRSFSFDNLMETLGTGVYGITWDGSAIWISVAGNRNKLVRVDPASGQITRTMSSPTMLGPTDLDFDAGTLWLSSGIGEVFALDPTTGGVLRTLPIPEGFSGRDHGVAARACELWVGGLFGGMGVEDPTNGAPLASVVLEDGSPLSERETGASLFIGDALVTANGLGITYYDIR